MSAEERRLQETVAKKQPWRMWGPYLSERQWGTVREDYGNDGNSWNYFTFEESHYRTYRWGEDGLAGQCDDKQHLCLCLALWNGADPVLKERLFGLTNSQGNHGEDVKEYYYYLDNTPTHSYQKFLYKYPQRAFPYQDLLEGSRRRGYHDFEYELIDTGIFQQDRYFDVQVEYAKGDPHDLLMEISISNRGPDTATLDVLPTLWFRNLWSHKNTASRPRIQQLSALAMEAQYPEGQCLRFEAEIQAQQLFTENESQDSGPYTKGAFHRRVIYGEHGAVNPENHGTKAAFWTHLEIPAGQTHKLRFRLYQGKKKSSFKDFQATLAARQQEADEFYAVRLSANLSEDQRNVARQALSGMLWSKQYYEYDLNTWLREHRAKFGDQWLQHGVRNRGWRHMVNKDIISMPDKWEYPWYAAWDLAFHTVSLALVDLDFAKRQLHLMLREVYLHPNGQLPAYEWNFGDVNPPVHAWATLYLYFYEKNMTGKGDLDFLKAAFHKLLLNFTWWVNRKDRNGQNVFEGGFLGLDNIGVFDRSSPLPTGGFLEQADGTAWMCLFCQNMLEMSLELAHLDENYIDMGTKFLEHFAWIAGAMDKMGQREDEMWDEKDGFFYDLLRLPNGDARRLQVRSLVGLLPFCAASSIDRTTAALLSRSSDSYRLGQRLEENPEMVANIHDPRLVGPHDRHLLSILDEKKLRRILESLLDPEEFLSDFGVRSLSRYHREHPFVMRVGNQEYRVDYAPAESTSGMFGGNSNWRGPIWFPINILIVRALLAYHSFYGDDFQVECPTGSGNLMNLYEVAQEISHRLSGIFLRNDQGKRPVFGGASKFQDDPHWRDHVLFYEYFHGDNGAGLGASHQTGWTGLVAPLMNLFATTNSQELLKQGRAAVMRGKRNKG
jgi:hypothetical protein